MINLTQKKVIVEKLRNKKDLRYIEYKLQSGGSPFLSEIILNINRLHSPIKKQEFANR